MPSGHQGNTQGNPFCPTRTLFDTTANRLDHLTMPRIGVSIYNYGSVERSTWINLDITSVEDNNSYVADDYLPGKNQLVLSRR